MSRLFVKDPNEVIDVSIDWTNLLDLTGSPDDTISSATWTLPDGSGTSPSADHIGISGQVISGALTNAFISSGEAQTNYRIKVVIETTAGATFERHIYVQVVSTEPALFAAGLVAEDGSIVAGANSYATREELSAFHAERNNTAWFDLTAQQMDAYAIRATDFMLQQYTTRWKGYRVDQDQTLDWPRNAVVTEDYADLADPPYPLLTGDLAFVVPNNIVPEEVKWSQAVLALEAANGDLNPVLTSAGSVKRVEAGPTAVEFFQGGVATGGSTKEIPAAEQFIRKLLKPIEYRTVRG